MSNTAFDNVVHFGRETVKRQFDYIGEEETPLLDYFMRRRKRLLTEQGYRIPIRTSRPGGHTSFGRSNVNFREPNPFNSDSMFTYPVWYALPFKVDGATLRSLKRGNEDQFMQYKDYMTATTNAAKKRINLYLHDDASGVLAVLGGAFASSLATSLSLQTLASSAAGARGTKGGVALEKDHYYSVIDTDGSTINFGFQVDTPSRTAPTVDASTAGGGGTNFPAFAAAGAAGDFVVDVGPTVSTHAYNKAPNGLRGLIKNSGILQNASLTTHPDLKAQRINGNDLPITPLMFENLRTLIRVAANDMSEASGRVCVMTPGQESILRSQQYGFRRYNGNETVKGVAQKYVDAPGDTYVFDADGAEDRVYMFNSGSLYLGEEKPFGMYNEDSQEIRMLHGTNNAGSDAFFGAIGWGGNLILEGLPRVGGYIDRLSQTDVKQQTSL